MTPLRGISVRARLFVAAGLLFATGPALKGAERDSRLPVAVTKPMPEGLGDLRAIQAHVQRLTDKLLPCTVALRVGAAQGSGVIIDELGHVLTAGHVSGEPGRKAEIVLHDGRKLRGVTLGANAGMDSGLVRITDRLPGAHAPLAHSSELRRGQWCIALGHPGGFQSGRPAVLRLGRLLDVNDRFLRTDCALVGGDSGGPLFDMEGRVIGIHSRIGLSLTSNIHVPVDTYHETWDRLAAGEFWGSDVGLFNFARPGGAYLGVETDPDSHPVRIVGVAPGSPAARAGIRPNDLLLRVDRQPIDTFDDLGGALRNLRPGAEVTLEVRRGDETQTLSVVLGERPE